MGAGGCLAVPSGTGQRLADMSSGGFWSTTGYVMPNISVSHLSLENRLNALLIHIFQENVFCNCYRKCCDRKGKGVGPLKRDLVGKGVSWARLD